MRFKKHLELEAGIRQIDVVPLISVIFLTFLFFILGFTSLTESGIAINVPQALTGALIKAENIEITISGENIVYLNKRNISFGELENFLKQVAKRKPSIFIKADSRCALGKIAEIWDMCRALGFAQISIATNQK